MKKIKIRHLILIAVAGIAVLGIAGSFAVSKINELRASAALKKMIAECPFDQPEGIAWEYIPSRNIAGLAGVGRYSNKFYNLDILVFENGKASDCIDSVIFENDSFYDGVPNYMFSIDEDGASRQKHYSYFMIKNETDEFYSTEEIIFYKDNVNVIVDYIDDMNLTYEKKDEENMLRTVKRQSFDNDKNRWSKPEVSEIEIKEYIDIIQHVTWEEVALEKNEPKPFHFQSGTAVLVDQYFFQRETGDKNTDFYEPQNTIINLIISTDIEMFGGGFSNEEIVLENEDFKLLKKSGDTYTDITPSDVTLEVNRSENGKTVTVAISSGELPEPQEGDYRIEFGQYNVDFKMTMQWFEAW